MGLFHGLAGSLGLNNVASMSNGPKWNACLMGLLDGLMSAMGLLCLPGPLGLIYGYLEPVCFICGRSNWHMGQWSLMRTT